MNKTELKQHLEESGEENLLITINVKINMKTDCVTIHKEHNFTIGRAGWGAGGGAWWCWTSCW